MAATSRYHRLPEDNRPSIDSKAGDNERLLGAMSPTSLNKGTKGFKFSYHPTFFLRLLVLALYITGLTLFL
jgi:hypothetical protein